MNYESTYLAHHGVLGMKWGVRRYRNPDGTLTAKGRKHYEKTGEEGYHYKSLTTRYHSAKANRLGKKIDQYKKTKDDDDRFWDEIKDGIKTKKGRTLYTADEVAEMRKSQKQADDKAISKLQQKQQISANRAKRSSEIDARMQDIATKTSTGKGLVSAMLLPGASKIYLKNEAVSSGKGATNTVLQLMTGIPIASINKYAYVHQDDKR